MRLQKALIAAALAGIAFAAHADETPNINVGGYWIPPGVGSVLDGSSGALSGSFTAGTSFTNYWYFQLADLSKLAANISSTYTANSGHFSDFAVSLYKVEDTATNIVNNIGNAGYLGSLTRSLVANLPGGQADGSTASGGTYAYNYNADSMSAGVYQLAVSGTASATNAGTSMYSVLLTREAPVAAVPEPSEWAMMLAGLGLVGFIARRRRAS